MKFVCRSCETFMLFQKAEEPGRDSLGITFQCPGCGARFAMVTNPGETHLVQALGVQLGGRKEAPQPFELTRSAMRSPFEPTGPSSKADLPELADTQGVAAAVEAGKGKCPFANMLAGSGTGAEMAGQFPAAPPSPSAISPSWTESAAKRLQNVPDFIRPAAKLMLERLASERGAAVVDDALMDEAKSRFM